MRRMILASVTGHAVLILGVLLAGFVSASTPPSRVYQVNLVELPGQGERSTSASSAAKKRKKQQTTAPKAVKKKTAAKKQQQQRQKRQEQAVKQAKAPAPKSGMTLNKKVTPKKRPRVKPRVKKVASKQVAKQTARKPRALPSGASTIEPRTKRIAAVAKRSPLKPRQTRQRAAASNAADSVNITASLGRRGGWTKESSRLSSGQSLTNDALNFPFMNYLRTVKRMIDKNFHVASRELSQGDVRKAVVYFQVDRSGRIMNLRMEKSSGSKEIDRSAYAAVQAVQETGSLPPLPEAYPAEVLSIHFGFEWVRQG